MFHYYDGPNDYKEIRKYEQMFFFRNYDMISQLIIRCRIHVTVCVQPCNKNVVGMWISNNWSILLIVISKKKHLFIFPYFLIIIWSVKIMNHVLTTYSTLWRNISAINFVENRRYKLWVKILSIVKGFFIWYFIPMR